MNIVDLDAHSVNPGDLNWKEIEELGNLICYDRSTPEEVIERAKDAEAILINKIQMTAEVMDQLPRLKYIGELATGYNNIDLKAASERGITVTNIPAYSTDSVAQMVFAHLLNVANRVEHYAQESRNGEWSRCPDFCYWNTPLWEIADKTIGIIGLGNIGSKVASIAHEFGMKILAYTSKSADQLPPYIYKATIDGLLSQSDVVSLHCPLFPDTHHLINADSLRKMQSHAILINTGRGPLVDEKAVAEALENHELRAYCADVMVSEPPAADNPLFKQKNAFITPHVAWATLEARERLMKIAANNLRNFIAGTPINVVN